MPGGRDGASFRDRGGRVYQRNDRIFRVLSPGGLAAWREFARHGLARELMAEGLLVQTREVPGDLAGRDDAVVLEHERVPFVSYAYEWPFSLLRRAALLHLHLLQRLMPAGFILSDATPSNVMFRGVRPVFIDVGSIVPHRPGDVWQGFGQFLETMLYPLLLAAYKGIPHQAWLRGAGERGLPARQVARLFGWSDVRRPGVLGYVKLSAALERVASGPLDVSRDELATAGVPAATLLRNVRKLERIVGRLRARTAPSPWLDYDGGAIYGQAARERKRAAVESAVRRLMPGGGVAWDLGCNTGEYALLAAPSADLVVAMDAEEPVVERLCQRCERQGPDNVLPLVVDIGDPSPAQGWRGAERRGLIERGPAALVLVLGLLHHLVLGRNLPADELLAELARAGRYCLVEHVAPDDAMARSLGRNAGAGRNELPERAAFEALVGRHFDVQEVTPLTETRRLYLLGARSVAA